MAACVRRRTAGRVARARGWAGGWRILAVSPQSLIVAGFGGCVCVGGREAGWLRLGLRGCWMLPLTVCVQAWQLLPCPAYSRQMCVRNSHALHTDQTQTRTHTHTHAGSHCPAASQPASQHARPSSRQPAFAADVQLVSSHCVRSVRSCSSSGRSSWRRRRRRPSLMLQSSRVEFGHVCSYHLD